MLYNLFKCSLFNKKSKPKNSTVLPTCEFSSNYYNVDYDFTESNTYDRFTRANVEVSSYPVSIRMDSDKYEEKETSYKLIDLNKVVDSRFIIKKMI